MKYVKTKFLTHTKCDIYLMGFGINSSRLKTEHENFLRSKLYPMLKGEIQLTIMGLASRSGSNIFNLKLSKRRALETYKFLQGIETAHGLKIKNNRNVNYLARAKFLTC